MTPYQPSASPFMMKRDNEPSRAHKIGASFASSFLGRKEQQSMELSPFFP